MRCRAVSSAARTVDSAYFFLAGGIGRNVSGMTDSTEDVELSPAELLESARWHLDAALEQLGRHVESVLLDDNILGAASLARCAAELLETLHRNRSGQ